MANFLTNLGKMMGPQAKMNSPQGGGEALPAYLQARTMLGPTGAKSAPIVTPKPSVAPNEVAQASQSQMANVAPAAASVPGAQSTQGQPQGQPLGDSGAGVKPQAMPQAQTPGAISIPHGGFHGTIEFAKWMKETWPKLKAMGYTLDAKHYLAIPPASNQGNWGDPQKTYDYLKGELQNATNDRKADATTDAAKRGVFYGTPLTGSYADIDTQYLKGLGSLDAAMWEKSSALQMQKLALAAQLIPQMRGGNFDPTTLALLGQLWGYGGQLPQGGS